MITDNLSEVEIQVYEEVTRRITIETPFTKTELSSDILLLAVEKSLSVLNKYKPNTVKSYDIIENPNFTLIRSYVNPFDTTSMISFDEELQLNPGTYFIYSKSWTLEDLINNRVAYDYLKSLSVCHAAMFMANKRRSATMNSLPFDIKGSEFYSEFKDRLDALTADIINFANNTL